MKKCKLIAYVSIISVATATPILVSSCSQSKSYTVMLTSPCIVHAQTNVLAENVIVASKAYIVDPDHKTATINIEKSKLTVEGPYLQKPYLVKNEQDPLAIDIVANVNKWDGSKINDGIINLKIEFILEDGTPLDYTTSVLIDYDYQVLPQNPILRIGNADSLNELTLSLHDGLNGPEVEGNVTWSVVSAPSGYEKDFKFSNNILKFDGSPAALLSGKVVKIKAEYNDYKINQNVIVLYDN